MFGLQRDASALLVLAAPTFLSVSGASIHVRASSPSTEHLTGTSGKAMNLYST